VQAAVSLLSLLLAVVTVGQGLAPLRKSDLVRLLAGSALSQGELAQLVSRNGLTFDPTERDRTDFRRPGAERALLAAVVDCAQCAYRTGYRDDEWCGLPLTRGRGCCTPATVGRAGWGGGRTIVTTDGNPGVGCLA